MKKFFAVLLFAISIETSAMAQLVVEEWATSYDGPGHGIDISQGYTLDRFGNFYITGRSDGKTSGQDFATIKYSPLGQRLLVLRYDGEESSWDEANAIVVDDSGAIYVTGSSFYSSSGTTMLTIRYNPDGSIAWLRHYPAPNTGNAHGYRIGLDAQRNVYVCGTPGFTAVKYTSSGQLLWASSFRPDSSTRYGMTDMVVSDAGFAYVVGGVARNCPEGLCIYDVALIKYTPSGDTAWVRYFGSSAFNEQPVAVRLSSTGDVIIAGRMNEDFLTLAFSNNGTLRWQQVYDGPDHSVDFPTGMTIDSHGNVIVAGTSWNNAEAFNYSVVKYSLSGQQLWAVQFNGSGNTRDFCYGVATDTNRNVYVTGSSVSGFTGPSRCSTVKFNHNGGHVGRLPTMHQTTRMMVARQPSLIIRTMCTLVGTA